MRLATMRVYFVKHRKFNSRKQQALHENVGLFYVRKKTTGLITNLIGLFMSKI